MGPKLPKELILPMRLCPCRFHVCQRWCLWLCLCLCAYAYAGSAFASNMFVTMPTPLRTCLCAYAYVPMPAPVPRLPATCYGGRPKLHGMPVVMAKESMFEVDAVLNDFSLRFDVFPSPPAYSHPTIPSNK